MCPVVTSSQHRRVRPQRDNNVIWRIVGKIKVAVDQWPSQGGIQCNPANRGHVHVWPRMLSFSEGICSLVQIQQSFEIARWNALRPAKRHQQIRIFRAVSPHWPECRLRSPICSIVGINQRIADVIIKRPHLLANSTLCLATICLRGLRSGDLRIRYAVQVG